MKVYITKYALTKGIIEKEVEINESYPKMATVIGDKYHSSFFKPYWYETKQQAIDHCEELKTKKIDSLHKQLKKLSRIEFK